MGIQHMTIGYIPKDWDVTLEIVAVGDPATYGVNEFNFHIKDDVLFYPGGQIQIDDGIWRPSSKFWKEVAQVASKALESAPAKPSSTGLGRAYQIFTEEDNDMSGLTFVSGPNDGGEFRNDDGKYNGRFFVHYVEELDDGEIEEGEEQYIDERILLI